MCVVSMIMDHYGDKWRDITGSMPIPGISQDEIDEFRRLLERAREYDRRNNEPDCELESKRQRVLELARNLGVEITFI